MRLSAAINFATLVGLAAAQYLVDPPTSAASNTILDCTYWHVASSSDTCNMVSQYEWLTLDEFLTYNPDLTDDCQFIVGNSYCVEKNWDIPLPPTTTQVVSTTTSATLTPTPSTLAGWCASEAGGYIDYCPRCLYRCQDSSSVKQCFNSVFTLVNYHDSQCWQHGGIDCENKAIDRVCPGP